MCRRCVNSSSQTRGFGSRWRGLIAVALAGFLLSGCGSLPTFGGGGEKRGRGAPEETVGAPVEAPLPPEAVQQFDRAVASMGSGDFTAAEQVFRSLAAAYPSYSGPVLNLGILQAKAGKLEEAEKTIRDAIARNGSNAAAFNQLGIVYRRLGRFKEADEAYTRAVQIDPNYALAYLNLGVLCDLYLQDAQRALEAYERYLSLASTPDSKVSGWVTELKKRIGSDPRSASTAQPTDQSAEPPAEQPTEQ